MTKLFALPKPGERFHALWPVEIKVPVEGGRVEKQNLKPRYNILTEAEIKGFFDSAIDALSKDIPDSKGTLRSYGPLGIIGMHRDSSLAFLSAAITDIEELRQIDDDGKSQPLAFSQDCLEAMVDLAFVRTALIEGYFKFQSGALEKN